MSFSHLVVGDTVLISEAGYQGTMTRDTVTRLTKTQVVVGRRRFWKEDGCYVGASTCRNYGGSSFLLEVTPERMAECELEEAWDAADNMSHKLRAFRGRTENARRIEPHHLLKVVALTAALHGLVEIMEDAQ